MCVSSSAPPDAESRGIEGPLRARRRFTRPCALRACGTPASGWPGRCAPRACRAGRRSAEETTIPDPAAAASGPDPPPGCSPTCPPVERLVEYPRRSGSGRQLPDARSPALATHGPTENSPRRARRGLRPECKTAGGKTKRSGARGAGVAVVALPRMSEWRAACLVGRRGRAQRHDSRFDSSHELINADVTGRKRVDDGFDYPFRHGSSLWVVVDNQSRIRSPVISDCCS